MADASGLRTAIVERAEQLARDATATILENVREAAPTDSGTLVSSIGETGITSTVGRYETTIAAPLEYASWQDEGTGVFGPRGVPIRPVNARALAWPATATQSGFTFPRAGQTDTGMVFAAEVQGTPATRFWSANVTAEAWTQALADAQ